MQQDTHRAGLAVPLSFCGWRQNFELESESEEESAEPDRNFFGAGTFSLPQLLRWCIFIVFYVWNEKKIRLC